MATIVNNPGNGGESSNSGMGFFMGMLVLLILGFLFFYYGLPAMRQATPQQDINVEVPNQPSDVNVQVPDQIDVNVTNPQEGQ